MNRRVPTIVIIATFIVANVTRAQDHQSAWRIAFDKAWNAAQAAEAAGDWESAAALYDEVQKLVPREAVSLINRGRCLAKLNRIDEAMRCLEKAVESGWTQKNVFKTEPAFTKLQDHPAAQRLRTRMTKVAAEHIKVYVPPTIDTNRPAPLIIAFHGRGENPHYFLPSWHEAADALRAVVVAPRGVHSRLEGMINEWSDSARKGPTSVIDASACEAVVAEAIRMAGATARIDRKRIIVAGYSQGGAVALHLLNRNPRKYLGAFAQATLYPKDADQYWKKSAADYDRPVVILAGEFDRLRHYSERLHADLQSAGWKSQLEIIPEVGHEPPPDNTQRQIAAIRYILDAPLRP